MQRYIDSGAFQKKGATFNLIIEMEPEQFATLFPNDGISCNVRIGGDVFPTLVQAGENTLLVSADTSNWKVGRAELDIRVEQNGSILMMPPDGIVTFQVIPSVTQST